MANLAQIEKYLKSKKIPYEVIDLGDEVFTVAGIVGAGVNEDEIVKTLVIRTNDGFAALAVRGRERLDFKKARKLLGAKSELAKASEVLEICKVPVGAVCPILLDIPVYFDTKVMDISHVHMGSGDLTRGLEMEFSDLLKAVEDYRVEDLTKI